MAFFEFPSFDLFNGVADGLFLWCNRRPGFGDVAIILSTFPPFGLC